MAGGWARDGAIQDQIDASVDDETGQFIFEDFNDRSIQRTFISRSLWEVRAGIDIRFGQ